MTLFHSLSPWLARLTMQPWKPLGLGGYGNMNTPAIGARSDASAASPPPILLNCDMGGAYLSFDLGLTWQLIHHRQLDGNPAVRPAFGPLSGDGRHTIYAGGAFGVLKFSLDGGLNWQRLPNDDEQFSYKRLQGEIAIHPTQPEILLISASDDSDFTGNAFFDETRCTNLALNTHANYVYRSADSGRHWQCVLHWNSQQPNLTLLHPLQQQLGYVLGYHFDRRASSAGQVVFAAAQRAVFRSHDAGQTWTQLALSGLPEGNLRSFAAASTAGGELRLYCTVGSRVGLAEVTGGVYVSSDGASWQALPFPHFSNVDLSIADDFNLCQLPQLHQVAVAPDNPQLLYVCGANFVELEHHEVACNVYRSLDGGMTWQGTFFPHPEDAGCNVTLNWQSVHNYPGRTTKNVLSEPGNDLALCPNDPDLLIRVGTRAYVRQPGPTPHWLSTDSALPATMGAAQPNEQTGWRCNGLVVTSAWHFYLHPHDPEKQYIVYNDCNYARSVDGGATWIWGTFERADRTDHWQNAVYELAFDPTHPNRMWGAFSNTHDIPNANAVLRNALNPERLIGRVGYSEDDGITWSYTALNTLPSTLTSIVYSQRSGERALYAAVLEDGIYRAEDTGAATLAWEPIFAGLPDYANRRFLRVVSHADGTLFVLVTGKRPHFPENRGAGLYRRQPASSDWELLGAGQGEFEWPRDFCVSPTDSSCIYLAVTEPYGEATRLSAGEANLCGNGFRPPTQSAVYQWNANLQNWKKLPLVGLPCSYRHFGVYLHPTQPNWLYVTLEGNMGKVPRDHGGLWLSQDGGETCVEFKHFPFKHVHRVSVDRWNGQTVLHVCTNGAGVWRGPCEPSDEVPYQVLPNPPL